MIDCQAQFYQVHQRNLHIL